MRWLTALMLMNATALAQDASFKYLILPDQKAAEALSSSAWDAIKCSPQPDCDRVQITKYLYPVLPLNDGTAVVVIKAGDPNFGENVQVKSGKNFALSPSQVSALVPQSVITPKLDQPTLVVDGISK